MKYFLLLTITFIDHANFVQSRLPMPSIEYCLDRVNYQLHHLPNVRTVPGRIVEAYAVTCIATYNTVEG